MGKLRYNFELYRYQIIPVDRKQLTLFQERTLAIEEIIGRKNEFFIEAFENLCSATNLDYIEGNKDIIFGKIYPKTNPSSTNEDVYIFVMAKQKQITRETDEFTSQDIDNWPKIHLIILNNEDEQIIAIERRTSAFNSTKNAVNKLSEKLNSVLELHNLNVHINPIYDSHSFWEYIDGKKIKRVEFSLITPNMANISKAISEELKDLAKSSNTAKTDLVLNAPKNSKLHITPENKQLSDLVDYASQGGGDIKVQTEGFKRSINITKGIKTISMDRLTISGPIESLKDVIINMVSNND